MYNTIEIEERSRSDELGEPRGSLSNDDIMRGRTAAAYVKQEKRDAVMLLLYIVQESKEYIDD